MRTVHFSLPGKVRDIHSIHLVMTPKEYRQTYLKRLNALVHLLVL